ncbi:MAG: hypothetical protein Q7K42_02545 [Candidatus Diapherotrites archaeon]|nr:hypothetical protein [Candidatus Diapherotrites archaeon]
MDSRWKNLGILLGVILVVVLVYFFVIQKPVVTTTTNPQLEKVGNLLKVNGTNLDELRSSFSSFSITLEPITAEKLSKELTSLEASAEFKSSSDLQKLSANYRKLLDLDKEQKTLSEQAQVFFNFNMDEVCGKADKLEELKNSVEGNVFKTAEIADELDTLSFAENEKVNIDFNNVLLESNDFVSSYNRLIDYCIIATTNLETLNSLAEEQSEDVEPNE